MLVFFTSLKPNAVTDQILADCVRIVKLKDMLAFFRYDQSSEQSAHIVTDKRFWNLIDNIEQKEHDVDLEESADRLHPGENSNRPGLVQ